MLSVSAYRTADTAALSKCNTQRVPHNHAFSHVFSIVQLLDLTRNYHDENPIYEGVLEVAVALQITMTFCTYLGR